VYVRASGTPQQIASAEADYQRLRAAYLDLLQRDPEHEVALAMVGADMDRAHARLQALLGLPSRPYAHEPSAALRREIALTRESTESD
jgi:hypothetical protein